VAVVAVQDQVAAAFAGRHVCYVRSYAARKGRRPPDPVMGVVADGLSVNVRAGTRPGWLALSARVAELESIASRESPAGPLGVPIVREARVETLVRLPIGRWTLLDGASPGWTFVARVTAPAVPEATAPAAPVTFDPPPTLDGGAAVDRVLDVTDLAQSPPGARGQSVNLIAGSSWDGEPPPCQRCLFQPEALVALVREVVGLRAWADGMVELRDDRLRLRGDPRAVEAATKVVDQVRRASSRHVTLRAELEGDPSRNDFVRLRARRGDPTWITSGRSVPYVLESPLGAADAPTPAPVTAFAWDGLVVDARTTLAPALDVANVYLSFTRSFVAGPIPSVRTTAGSAHVPTITILRFRTHVRVPVGGTVVVGHASDGERTRTLRLTATADDGG
jgi:hypothetical protein